MDRLARGASTHPHGAQFHKEEKLALLAAIVDSSDDAIISKDLDGTITSWNRGAEKIYGYSAEEMIGRRFSVLIHPAHPEDMSTILQRIRSGEHIRHFETVRVRKGGGPLPVSLSESPICDADGKIIGLSSIARDITERRRVEEQARATSQHAQSLIEASLDPLVTISPKGKIGLARSFSSLADSEQRYRTLTENAHDAISVLTPDGVIREVNRQFTDTFGYSADQMVGRHIRDFAALGREEKNMQSYGQTVATGSGRTAPVEIRKADGSIVLMEFSNSAVQVGGERLVFSIGRDVTEQMRAQAQLMISDRMASVGTLAAGVAHGINNPLAVVLGNLELAVKDADEMSIEANVSPRLVELQESLHDARDAALRVREIVKDLKIFSRAEEDRLTAVDVHQVLESTLRMAWTEIRHRARLVKTYGKVPCVDANESRLGQVFLNLIVNAAQAIPEGHANANEIRVVTGTDAIGRAVVEVRDTGPGMTTETLKMLFTPFFSTKPTGVGTGLGLTMCQRIVNGLGGEIAVESQPGSGTTFKVILPAARGDHMEEAPVAVPPSAVRRGPRAGRR
ncbi:PAS domain-containing sensor histidine kinase [Rhizobacter sp. Root1221]|uniref:PAS domain-containing sensor histidine kinase n=1 Tax=Rhizobacter sp. Root1221 TaxID=1736433 RepID=UPI0006F9B343|nr:PAS domain-containing sensor histidine kinase [Rhizobacter sp. Root1221]KQW02889.1 hypothetical protein ASC87_00605 [Rhizobacter sp. Root1221]